MAQITKTTEPRTSFLLAVLFTGAALLVMSGKGWLPSFVGWLGNCFMFASLGWQLARAWYLRHDG